MRTQAARSEIADRVEYIRKLHRQIRPVGDKQRTALIRGDQKAKDFLSNLRRTSERPTLNMVRAMQDVCSLTTDGAHRLFGYELDAIREFDLRLNAGRTHIIESYVFERDLLVELPLELASADAFVRTSTLSTLVRRWQRDIPIRALDEPSWRRPGAFYVHVGTQDSSGSSVPPGSTALVEPITPDEAQRPNPRATYLLQFRNGYRCGRCVITRGSLQLLTSDRSYHGPELFPYPGSVRIVGRIRVFALRLPLPEHRPSDLSNHQGRGNLLLPWEHATRASFLLTKHNRFDRSKEEQKSVDEFLEAEFHSKISQRTRRRYRHETDSQPHVDTLIQMSVEHYARYTDSLRTGGHPIRDRHRYSLETMLRAKRYEDLILPRVVAIVPTPPNLWEALRQEFVEWPALLSLKFPLPSSWGERMIRVAGETEVPGHERLIRPGSWLLTEELPLIPDVRTDASKKGWCRPLYALRRGVDVVIGHLDRDSDGFVFLRSGEGTTETISIGADRILDVRRVCGALVPV